MAIREIHLNSIDELFDYFLPHTEGCSAYNFNRDAALSHTKELAHAEAEQMVTAFKEQAIAESVPTPSWADLRNVAHYNSYAQGFQEGQRIQRNRIADIPTDDSALREHDAAILKPFEELAEKWREDFRENRGGDADCASRGCAEELAAAIKQAKG